MSRTALWPCLVWGKLFDSLFPIIYFAVCFWGNVWNGPFPLRFTIWSRAYKVHKFIKTCPSVCQDTCPFISALSFQSVFLPVSVHLSHLLTATSSCVYYFLIFVSQVFSSSSDKETDNSKAELSLKSEEHRNPDETDTDTKVSASLSPSFTNYLAVSRFSQETEDVVL